MPLTPNPPILSPRLLAHLASRFNCDLTIVAQKLSPDGQGGSTRDKNWTPVVEVLGAVEALSGAERLAEGGPGSSISHRILIGYVTGVDITMRVLYGTRTFDIATVIDYSEQHLLLEILASEQFRK